VECGAPTIAPVDMVRELLYYRDMRFNNHRDWGMLTAFLAGSSLALPVLAPFAVGSMIALGVHEVRGLRKRTQIVGIEMQHVAAAPGSTTLFGVARRFRSTVSSLVDDAPVLVEHAVVRDRHGAVLLRRSESAPFLLDVDDHGPVLVTGVARVASPNILSQRMRVKRGDPRLGRMGVPEDLAVSGDLEISSVLADGGLAVTGIVEDEAVAELAFHRGGGLVPVMRGRVGAPVLVEDRRLIAAAL
jgi:hypothetical protein